MDQNWNYKMKLTTIIQIIKAKMDEFVLKLETYFKDIDLAKESLMNFKKKINDLKDFNQDDMYTYE